MRLSVHIIFYSKSIFLHYTHTLFPCETKSYFFQLLYFKIHSKSNKQKETQKKIINKELKALAH